jgi:hypothetical protein
MTKRDGYPLRQSDAAAGSVDGDVAVIVGKSESRRMVPVVTMLIVFGPPAIRGIDCPAKRPAAAVGCQKTEKIARLGVAIETGCPAGAETNSDAIMQRNVLGLKRRL